MSLRGANKSPCHPEFISRSHKCTQKKRDSEHCATKFKTQRPMFQNDTKTSFRGSETTEESKTNRFFADAPQNDGKRAAFTLAETLIVLVILGVVAAITVPALVRNQMEVQNRTRLRKAMTVYDMAINKMVVENNFKSNTALTDWANGNNCVNTREYFKIVHDGKNGCIFSTAGGLWWNISDITKLIVGFNENDIEAANSTTSFQLVSHFDPNGALRVDDLAYELKINSDDLDSLQKIYAFINGEKVEECGSKCKVSKYLMTDCENPN